MVDKANKKRVVHAERLIDSAFRTNGWKQLSGKKGGGLAGGFFGNRKLSANPLGRSVNSCNVRSPESQRLSAGVERFRVRVETLLAAVVRMESI